MGKIAPKKKVPPRKSPPRAPEVTPPVSKGKAKKIPPRKSPPRGVNKPGDPKRVFKISMAKQFEFAKKNFANVAVVKRDLRKKTITERVGKQ